MSNKNEFYCLGCQKKHKKSAFYVSYNPIHNGIMPLCKSFIKKEVIKKDKSIDLEKLKSLLMQMDAPFLADYWKRSVDDEKNTIGMYFKNLSLKQNRGLQWKDSTFEQIANNSNSDVELEEFKEENFTITRDVIRKWGSGFNNDQYMMLEDLYEGLARSFDIENRSQDEYLKTACLYQLRNMESIRSGNSNEAKKWGDLFDSYMASGKLKPNQISDADRMGGVTNFSTFFQYVEKSNDFIPTFPDLILDDIDYAIYMFMNYNRQLMDMPEITLGEVKKFMTYDYEKGQEIIMPTIEEGDGDGRV